MQTSKIVNYHLPYCLWPVSQLYCQGLKVRGQGQGLVVREQGQGLEVGGQGTGLVNWSSRILVDSNTACVYV